MLSQLIHMGSKLFRYFPKLSVEAINILEKIYQPSKTLKTLKGPSRPDHDLYVEDNLYHLLS